VVRGIAIQSLQVAGPWERLHRAESKALASLLTANEQDAVNRRLGLPALSDPVAWIPDKTGELGGRFTEPRGPGALYLGNDLSTCLKEIIHHHAVNCAASVGTPAGTQAVFRHLFFQVSGTLADASVVRGSGLHDPLNHAPSWNYGRRARAAGLEGVHFRSVRRRGGRCLAVFNNRAARFLHVEYGAVVLEWDGTISRRIA